MAHVDLISAPQMSVLAGTTKPPLAAISSDTNSVCPKCGIAKKSGKLSCCARGGAWFKKCGDAGSTKFDHTWAEGIQACERQFLSASVISCMRIVLDIVLSTWFCCLPIPTHHAVNLRAQQWPRPLLVCLVVPPHPR